MRSQTGTDVHPAFPFPPPSARTDARRRGGIKRTVISVYFVAELRVRLGVNYGRT